MPLGNRPIEPKDVVLNNYLTQNDVISCIQTSEGLVKKIVDRKNLHDRAILERFINILTGELAEQLVLKWLISNGINAELAVDKESGHADQGYDIIIHAPNKELHCSVKSSTSVFKSTIEEIIDNFTISTTLSEVQDVNVQVYFWYELDGKPRITVPSEHNLAIIGWAGKKDLKAVDYASYTTESRKAPKIKLRDLRPMTELLRYLKMR